MCPAHRPTARAVGYSLVPATRAEFMNDLPLQDTREWRKIGNPRTLIIQRQSVHKLVQPPRLRVGGASGACFSTDSTVA